jgi:hypothetical protein
MIRMSERAFRYLPPAGALVAEDALIKYARDGGGSTDWNPALHPRTGAPPNPGWFAPTDGAEALRAWARMKNDNPVNVIIKEY